jgi:tRNA dimethylallyltransferase
MPAEVVSADSRQVYRGLDIGTAKVTAEERARVVHHGLDLVDPDQPFTVADFRAHALAVLADLGGRGGIGILAGGTGFWLRAVFAGIDTVALPWDPGLRARLGADLAAEGVGALTSRLQALAPRLASRTDLQNPRRVVRALEIATLQGDAPLPRPVGYPAPVLGLQLAVEPTEHRRRIEARAQAQFDAGLIEEARFLRQRWDPALPCFTAIGYHESWACLDGSLTREEAVALDARNNLAFAKRQRTWFRAERSLEVVDATADPRGAVLPRIKAFLGS